jgi:hypothetical protein
MTPIPRFTGMAENTLVKAIVSQQPAADWGAGDAEDFPVGEAQGVTR